MKGDFTRDTFDAKNHFSRVLMQQGRVTLDADHNEQTAILIHYLRALARDLIGPYAAPVEARGFALSSTSAGGLNLSPGRYYVDGILVENEESCSYTAQPNYPLPSTDALLAELNKPAGNWYWLYLDVWERHITPIEYPAIREVALDGPDTCTRAKVVWQVKALPMGHQGQASPPGSCSEPLGQLPTISSASLTAELNPGAGISDPCVLAPSSIYRGAENQLYRVEIHDGGAARATGTPFKTGATFKWSRDNGSVATSWMGVSGNDLQVAQTRGFDTGNWVELSDDISDLQGIPGVLVQVVKVDNGVLSIDPSSLPSGGTGLPWSAGLVNPKVRRWDQSQTGAITLVHGVVPVQETALNAPVWIALEDGIQVQFTAGGTYRTGDYWLIPARVATGNIEWPIGPDGKSPVALPPLGIQHHYAPLGYVNATVGAQGLEITPCGCTFKPLSSCFNAAATAVGGTDVAPQPDAAQKPAAANPK